MLFRVMIPLDNGLIFSFRPQDGTILATAIPKITNYFNSLDDVAWYGSSYLFTICAVQLMYGKIYTFYPTKWVFLTGVIIFELGSLICAVAPTSTALIVGRSIAGLGAAVIFSGAIIIIAAAVPLRLRPIYTALLTTMHGIASVVGPL
jgi:MFS family permease